MLKNGNIEPLLCRTRIPVLSAVYERRQALVTPPVFPIRIGVRTGGERYQKN